MIHDILLPSGKTDFFKISKEVPDGLKEEVWSMLDDLIEELKDLVNEGVVARRVLFFEKYKKLISQESSLTLEQKISLAKILYIAGENFNDETQSHSGLNYSQEAAQLLEKAIALRELKLSDDDELRELAGIQREVGMAYEKIDSEKSAKFYEAAATTRKKISVLDPHDLNQLASYQHLAALTLDNIRRKPNRMALKALELYESAIETLEKISTLGTTDLSQKKSDSQLLVICLEGVGHISYELNDFDKSESAFFKAIQEIKKNIDCDDYEQLHEIYKQLCHLYPEFDMRRLIFKFASKVFSKKDHKDSIKLFGRICKGFETDITHFGKLKLVMKFLAEGIDRNLIENAFTRHMKEDRKTIDDSLKKLESKYNTLRQLIEGHPSLIAALVEKILALDKEVTPLFNDLKKLKDLLIAKKEIAESDSGGNIEWESEIAILVNKLLSLDETVMQLIEEINDETKSKKRKFEPGFFSVTNKMTEAMIAEQAEEAEQAEAARKALKQEEKPPTELSSGL